MGEFTNDPTRHFQQGAVPEVLHDLKVGRQCNIYEARVKRHDLKECSQVVIDTVFTDEILELVKDLIHPPEEDLPIVRKSLNKEQALLYEVSLLSLLRGLLSEQDNLIEDMLGIFRIGDLYEQSDGLIGQGDVIGVEALNQQHLPSLQAVLVEFDQLVQAAYAKVLHVVVASIEELVDVGH